MADVKSYPANFTINERAKNYGDVQRVFMWQVLFPGINALGIADSAIAQIDDLLVRCRSVHIPDRSTEAITSYFMGTRQFFPGKTSPGPGNVSLNFEETEDQVIHKTFYEWSQHVFNTNPDAGFGAGKSAGNKDYVTTSMFLLMFRYDGVPLPRMVKFHNVWPQTVGDVALSYEGTDSVKFDITFQYDHWTHVVDPGVSGR